MELESGIKTPPRLSNPTILGAFVTYEDACKCFDYHQNPNKRLYIHPETLRDHWNSLKENL